MKDWPLSALVRTIWNGYIDADNAIQAADVQRELEISDVLATAVSELNRRSAEQPNAAATAVATAAAAIGRMVVDRAHGEPPTEESQAIDNAVKVINDFLFRPPQDSSTKP